LFTEKISWYWNRLRAMSVSEISLRLKLALRKSSWRRRTDWRAANTDVKPQDTWKLGGRPDADNADLQALLAEAERTLNGSAVFLNITMDMNEIDWHLDPQLGVHLPVTFGPDVEYRDPNVSGNVKNIWELNRHQHLTVLAVAYAMSSDDRYATEIERQLESWQAANPPINGVNWHSALEVGVRLISWVWVERLLRGSASHERLFGLSGNMWSTIYWHQWFISRFFSQGSSSNNHLIGELVGLFVASTVWPYFEESGSWQKMTRRGIEREVAHQTFASGLNKEQAFSYHFFVFELFLVAGMEAERAGGPFSAAFVDAMKRMIEVVPQVTDHGGNLPRFACRERGGREEQQAERRSRSAAAASRAEGTPTHPGLIGYWTDGLNDSDLVTRRGLAVFSGWQPAARWRWAECCAA